MSGPIKNKRKVAAEFMWTIHEQFKPFKGLSMASIRGNEEAHALIDKCRLGFGYSETTQKHIILEAMNRAYKDMPNYRI